MTGFSPQKQTLTVHIMPGFTKHEALMKKLGKYKMGKSCLHIKKIEPKDEKGIFSFSSGAIRLSGFVWSILRTNNR